MKKLVITYLLLGLVIQVAMSLSCKETINIISRGQGLTAEEAIQLAKKIGYEKNGKYCLSEEEIVAFLQRIERKEKLNFAIRQLDFIAEQVVDQVLLHILKKVENKGSNGENILTKEQAIQFGRQAGYTEGKTTFSDNEIEKYLNQLSLKNGATFSDDLREQVIYEVVNQINHVIGNSKVYNIVKRIAMDGKTDKKNLTKEKAHEIMTQASYHYYAGVKGSLTTKQVVDYLKNISNGEFQNKLLEKLAKDVVEKGNSARIKMQSKM